MRAPKSHKWGCRLLQTRGEEEEEGEEEEKEEEEEVEEEATGDMCECLSQ